MTSVQIIGDVHQETQISKALDTGVVSITSTELPSISDSESVSVISETSQDALSPPSSVNEGDSTAVVTIAVLKIIETYGLNFERSDSSWDGLETFIPVVTKQIERGEPVRMLLPGFPFKSPNATDKVISTLPDLGEQFALSHLNGLCQNIAAIYEHGAEVHICSDGLVYNDLLGVPDEAVWEYGEAVRQIAIDQELHHLKFIRIWELLEHPGSWSKEYYVAHASCIRRELWYRYRDAQFEADLAAKSDEDVRLTLSSYIEFLSKDLAYSKEHTSLSDAERTSTFNTIAKNMMGRWKAFTSALQENRGDFVRLSIHDSVGKGKLSMSLVPQKKGALGYTPWHSTIAVELDGSYRTVHASEVRDTHKLIYRNGRPWFYRAKSDLFEWAKDDLHVTFEHLYPCGLIVRPVTTGESSPSPSIRTLPMQKVRALSNTFSPVVLRGFSETTKEDLFINKAHELGKVLVWPQYGILAKVKDAGRSDKNANNVTSNEAMPMHFDGIFKYKDVEDAVTGEIKKVLNPPGYQYFTCIATASKGNGYTLFCSSRLFFRHLAAPWSVDRLEPVTWGTVNTGFWKQNQEDLKLVVRHPVTNEPCMRWHEPWTKTKYSTCKVIIENEEQGLVDVINQLIYDYRTCLRFSWEQGDLLINDNVSMLHTRTAYESECDREMWRIHFD